MLQDLHYSSASSHLDNSSFTLFQHLRVCPEYQVLASEDPSMLQHGCRLSLSLSLSPCSALSTFFVSTEGEGVFICSPSEVQRFSVSSTVEETDSCLPVLFTRRLDPSPKKKKRFTATITRDEMCELKGEELSHCTDTPSLLCSRSVPEAFPHPVYPNSELLHNRRAQWCHLRWGRRRRQSLQ